MHNGLDWGLYPNPSFYLKRNRFHFLGKAAWKVKNVQGAIDITKYAKQKLDVLGGHRINFKMGFRCTFDRHVNFLGMVDELKKKQTMSRSKGLIFPVTWHEPFGLAIIESMYFGCPVFGTPYGSLPELVLNETGFLSSSESEIIDAITHNNYMPKRCNEFAEDIFSSNVMADKYIEKYGEVISGKTLNKEFTSTISNFRNLKYRKAEKLNYFFRKT